MAADRPGIKEFLLKIKAFFAKLGPLFEKLKPFFAKLGPFFAGLGKKIKEFFVKLAGELRDFEWDPKKMTKAQKRKLLVYGGAALVVLILLIVIICLIVHSVSTKKDTKESGYTFTTDGYEDIEDAECLDESIIVWTDKKGKKGIITLDGEITQDADQDSIYSVSSDWRKSQIVAERSSSKYLYYVDSETGTVTNRQYQEAKEPEKEAVWSDENNSLEWKYSDGSFESVGASDIVLSTGLYPVAYYSGSSAQWGYINQSGSLVIKHIYSGACDFSEGLAAVEKGSKWGYIDETGKTIIPISYSAIGDKAFSFRNGLVPVRDKDGMCGIITRSGSVACRFDFDVILQGKDGKYIAQKNGRWGLLTVNSDVYDTANTEVSTTASSVIKYRVTTSGGELNMRGAADADSEKITTIPNGTEVEYVESADGWIKVRYNGAEGWVKSDYVVQVS